MATFTKSLFIVTTIASFNVCLGMGGKGGDNRVSKICTGNNYITEIYGTAGDVVDSIGARCSDGTLLFNPSPDPSVKIKDDGRVGGNGGKYFNIKRAGGFRGFVGNVHKDYVNGLQPLAFSSELKDSVYGTQYGGADKFLLCPHSQRLIGLEIHSGDYIDFINIICE